MEEQVKKERKLIRDKMCFTGVILLAYFIGRSLPLFGVDFKAYELGSLEAKDLMLQMVRGDRNRISLFALGISPYMIASMLVQITVSFINSEQRAKISPRRMNLATIFLMLGIAIVEAFLQVQDLTFKDTLSTMRGTTMFVAGLEMVVGTLIILWLSERNKKYGIGGQTALIFINIIDGVLATILGNKDQGLLLPMLISLLGAFIIILLENTEKRIPVQRISIHNIHADKNYIAIKLNPLGVMPVMFASAFFMVPLAGAKLLAMLFPRSQGVLYLVNHMDLSQPLGIIIYIGIIHVLTLALTLIFINPGDMTEQLLKSGDSIPNLHSGKETKAYLKKEMVRISMMSSAIMSLCIGVPLLLQYFGYVTSALVMLPASTMMLMGVCCNLYQEVHAVRNLDAYKPFI